MPAIASSIASAAVAMLMALSFAGCASDMILPRSQQKPELVVGDQAIAMGSLHACAITAGGVAYCWGGNSSGQLGDGTTVRRDTITAVAGSHTYRQISAVRDHTCAITRAGEAYCWGEWYGPVPLAISPGLSFSQISAGSGRDCAVATDQNAYCWQQRTSPERVPGGLLFKQVSNGDSYTCGLTTNNRVYCWVLQGAEVSPTPLATTPRLAQISAESYYVLGLTADSAVLVIGSAEVGTTVKDGVRQISGGPYLTCFLDGRGEATCWKPGQRAFPVGGILSYRQIAIGGNDEICGLADGRAYCWTGQNRTPTLVPGDVSFD